MAVHLSEAAIRKIKELRLRAAEEKRTTEDCVLLRMGVKGGGCSGLTYLLEFDTEKTTHDLEFEIEGIAVIVDKKSYLYLNGTALDYIDQGLTGGFAFHNPKAQSSCGCGTSFNPKPASKENMDPALEDPHTTP